MGTVRNYSGTSSRSLLRGSGATDIAAGLLTSAAQGALDSRVSVSVEDGRFASGAKGDGTTDDTAAINAAIAYVNGLGGGEVFFPAGTYRTTNLVNLLSNVTLRGTGRGSVIYNDKTNGGIDRRACVACGWDHPGAYVASQYTSYALSAIAAGASVVTMATPGQESNFAVGQLVRVIDTVNVASGVPRIGQLTKVDGIGSGTIRLKDQIDDAITSPAILAYGGATDASTGIAWSAVENVAMYDLGFKGRAALATKGAVYGFHFARLHMIDTHLFFGTNTLTNGIAENIFGEFSGRMIELAYNSYNVTLRNFRPRFKGLTALQAGETQVLPVNLGEQCRRITLDDIPCRLDDRYTLGAQLAQIKGNRLTIKNCGWENGGTQNQECLAIPSGSYGGYPYDNIDIVDCRLGNLGTKARVCLIGSASTDPPQHVRIIGGEMYGAPTESSTWCQYGQHLHLGYDDRTGKTYKLSTTAMQPVTSGYRKTA